MAPDNARLVSVVIPVLNEAESLPQLAAELQTMASEHRLPIEVVLVDDGSADGSWQVISRLAASDARFSGLRLRRSFGKAPALAAGFAAAHGDIIVTMDGDLQDDPNEVPKLLAAIYGGYDIVSGWRRTRRDPWHKAIPSRLFNLLVAWLTGVKLHDVNCGLKAYRREALQEVALYGELHRFIPVLAHARGFRAGEAQVAHRPRIHGRSKFGTRRFVRGLLDLLTVKLLTDYRTRPLHLLGGVGLLALLLGFVGVVYLAVAWVSGHGSMGTRPLLTCSVMAALLGGQMIALGFLAELLIAYHIRQEPPYSVAERMPASPPDGLATPPPTA
jgi:glycosyltransferase involved in cell wall biosynthesis